MHNNNIARREMDWEARIVCEFRDGLARPQMCKLYAQMRLGNDLYLMVFV